MVTWTAVAPAALAAVTGLFGFVFGRGRQQAETTKITTDGEGSFVSSVQSFITELMAANKVMLVELNQLRDDLAAETAAREAAERRVDELQRQVESQRALISRLEVAARDARGLFERRQHGNDPRVGGRRSTDPGSDLA